MKCNYCDKEHKNKNTGCANGGYRNSGYRNSGDYNSGYRNSRDYNSGDYNSGDYNSGDRNSGYRNSGDRNSGWFNSGDRNSGCYNSGYYNSGCYNSGCCNSGDYNSGWFNTDDPNMRMFNKETNIKYSDFNAEVYPDLKICSWVSKKDLLEEEKTKEVEQMGGMLKTLTYHEAWQEYWTRASEEDKEWFTTLPNFDSNIFKEITSIDINQETEEMTMEEVCKALGKTIKIKK